MTSEWSAAIKDADPLGFHAKSSAEDVDAARETGRHAFETTNSPYTPKWSSDHPDPAKVKEIFANLGDPGDGRPLDPTRAKDFRDMLHEKDPLRKYLDGRLKWDEERIAEMRREYESDPSEEMRRMRLEEMKASAAKNAGEAEGGADGNTWRWEQTSKDGDSEILIRFTLPSPATKKEVKVVFKPQGLKVTVAGEVLFDRPTYGKIYPDECTWSLVERTESGAFSELQVLISLTEDVKWEHLCADE